MGCGKSPHRASVYKHHALLSKNPSSLLRINHLRPPVVESPGPVAQSSDLPPPPPRRYHSPTSDTELIAPTRQVRCTIVQGPNRKFRPETELCLRGVTWGYLKSSNHRQSKGMARDALCHRRGNAFAGLGEGG